MTILKDNHYGDEKISCPICQEFVRAVDKKEGVPGTDWNMMKW